MCNLVNFLIFFCLTLVLLHTHTRTGAVLNTATRQLSSTLGVHQLELGSDLLPLASIINSTVIFDSTTHSCTLQKELQLVQHGNFLLMGCQLWDYSTYMATLRDDYSTQQQLHCWDLVLVNWNNLENSEGLLRCSLGRSLQDD